MQAPNVGFTSFDQRDIHADTSNSRHFVNWYPQANVSYAFTNQSRLMFRYNGVTRQPTITDIQPIPTNEDPLNISIGNPSLKPQFQNSLSLFYNNYKVLTDRGIFFGVSYQFTENAISNSNFVDSSGRRVYQAVNVDGNQNVNLFNYNIKWKKPDIRIGFNPVINYSRYVNIVNNVNNVTNSGNYSFAIYTSKSKEKKYEFTLNSSATYTSSKSSIQENITTNYWTYNIHPEAEVYLPLKFQIHSDWDFNFRQKTVAFDNNTNVILWNAWIGKKFLKGDALTIKASVNDLLNQNLGFNRTVNSNFISQNTYSTIQRFFMLPVIWNFTKAGAAGPTNNFF